MLRAMRKGALSVVFLGILLLGGVGLVLTDAGGFFRSGAAQNDVAQVGKASITRNSFDETVRNLLQARDMTAAQAYKLGFIDRILQARINDHIVYMQARKAGIRIPEEMLASQTQEIIAPILAQTDLTTQQAFERFLRIRGMSREAFFAQLKEEIATQTFSTSFTSNSYTPAVMARNIYQYRNETRDITGLYLGHDRITDIQPPEEEVLKRFYDSVKNQYTVPEQRDLTFALLDTGTIRETIEIPDDQIRAFYDANKALFITPEKRTVAQAVLQDEATAQEVAARLKNNDMALKDAVREVTGTAESYLGKQSFEREGLVPAIAQAVFGAGRGQVAGPVKTTLGWHVIHVRDIKEEAQQKLDQVRDQIREQLLQEQLGDQIFEVANDLDDRLATGAPLQSLQDSFGLMLVDADSVTRGGKVPGALTKGFPDIPEPDLREMVNQAFQLQSGFSTPVTEIGDAVFMTVQVDAIRPEKVKPLAEIRDQLIKRWKQEQQKVLNIQRAGDILERLDPAKTDMDTLIKELNGEDSFNLAKLEREGDPPAPLTQAARHRLFQMEQGVFDLIPIADGVIIARVQSIAIPDAKDLDEEKLSALRNELDAGFQDSVFASLIRSWRQDYDIDINRDVLESLYGGDPL